MTETEASTIRVSVTHVNELQAENADLRRQVDELRQALEWVVQVALDALGADRTRTDRLEAQRIIHGRLKATRAALARQEETE